jgi:hypothetical protein
MIDLVSESSRYISEPDDGGYLTQEINSQRTDKSPHPGTPTPPTNCDDDSIELS